jgi:hypothetical protein
MKTPTFAAYIGEDKDPLKLVEQLKEYSRDSDELHPALLGALEQCVFMPPLDEAALSSIATIGRPGILISTALRFIYGQTPNLAKTIPLLDRWAKIWSDKQSKPAFTRLSRIWRILRESSLREDPSAKQEYLAALDKEFLEGETWKLAVAWDILEVRGSLLENQVTTVFREFANHPSFLHEVVYVGLCRWLSGDITQTVRQTVLLAAKEAVVICNETPWVPTTDVHTNVWADLLFPAICWAYGDAPSEATEAVFLRGIRAACDYLPHSGDEPRTNLGRLLALLEPLLAKSPPETLKSVIQQGLHSLEPSISGFCRLVASMATVLKTGA